MPVFHRIAYEAACRAEIPPDLTDGHFDSWEALETALLWLPTDEQRCDAIYGDWLMQLDAPGGTERLAIRDLLIGSGALAANYLAELAQNANDAADGQEASVRVILHEDWLVFANDGRKVTPLNQIGLCRFFRHFDPGMPLMQVIGQFGVGFKSSFRVADEVFVESWHGESRFAFRLPITSSTRPHSLPDESTRQRVLQQLSALGVHINGQLLQPQYQGFCTPEFFKSLPPVLEPRASSLRETPRGTLFAFHLHSEGRTHVSSRIQGQAKELYELCPLFLPWLRTVQIGANELKMDEGRELARDGIADAVIASRVTLTTTSQGTTPSRSRFWRLRGIADGDQWQIALHADSDFKLRLERAADEQGMALKDGGAYAYFPLNKVVWPFRFHLHLNLQPNLPRDDWNPGLESQVLDQLRRAVFGLALWLEKQPEKRSPLWRVESLLVREPSSDPRNEQERWSRQVWNTMLQELKTRPLLKTVWGAHVTSEEAVTARLINKDAVRRNWTELCNLLHGFDTEFPIVDVAGITTIGLTELPDSRLRQFFLKAAGQAVNDAARRSLVMALFMVESAEPETLERVADDIEIPCADGTSQPLSRLMKRPGGADLPDEWHALFHTLRNWLWEIPHGLTSVFDGQLRFQLKKLAERAFNPRWEAIPVDLGNDHAWTMHGTDFWNSEREPCPAGCRKPVVLSLQVKDGTNQWKPISALWLGGNSSVECFRGVVAKWEPGIVGNQEGQRRVRDKLREWQLWDEWENAVEERLREGLPKRLAENLAQQSETRPRVTYVTQPFEAVFQGTHTNSREQLSTRWKAVIRDAEQKATQTFIRSQREHLADSHLVASDLDQQIAAFLIGTGMFKTAPRWLTPFAMECIREAGEGEWLESLSLLKRSDMTEQGRRDLAGRLLERFYLWSGRNLTEPQMQAFQNLCEGTPPTERRNWKVGITSRTSLLLRDLLNPEVVPGAPPDPIQPQTDDGSLNQQMLLMLEGIRWHQSEQLPALLRRVPAVANASLNSSCLRVEVSPASSPLPARAADVLPETANNLYFRLLLRRFAGQLARCASPLAVRWLNGDTIVAEIRDAPFAVLDGQLVTTQVQRVLEDKQFTEILSLYARSSRGGQGFEEFQHAWQSNDVPHAELYAKHRKLVVHTLLKTLVTDQGYREHHVVRELLQNAESAYDSKPGASAAICEFEFILHPPNMGGAWEAVASHSGRHFNEPFWNRRLNQNIDRSDIRLIVGTPSSEAPPTEGWIGRFNRGFKALFTVTDRVEVISGPYQFAIHDMLRLDPANPQPQAGPPSTQTKFSFRCSQSDVLKLLQLKSVDRQQSALPIFNASSFVFLQRVNRVRIQAGERVWAWTMSRKEHSTGWSIVEIDQSFPPLKERFLVHHGEIALRNRFAVAIRLDADLHAIQPAKLEVGWHKIRLTFPTEDDFPLEILVNGDFETDSGRLGIRSSPANETLLAACLKAVRELCEVEVRASTEPKCWLSWADSLHLAKGDDELIQRFENHKALKREWESASEFLCEHIPHDGESVPVKDLTFPTTLVRRLEAFVVRWGFPVRNWIEKGVEVRLPRNVREECSKQSLDGLLGPLPCDVMERILADFNRPEFLSATDQLGAPEKDELERARRLLERSLSPFRITTASNYLLEPWSVAQLWEEWQKQGQPAEQYKLDGVNWTLLFPQDQTPILERSVRLKNLLQSPQSKDGKNAWYRVLGFACLMSGAGHGRMESLRRFWSEELDNPQRKFWHATGDHDFSEATKALFNDLALRQSRTNAQGEWADYWRHIFYDVRKVHELIWNQEFADTVLRLLIDPQQTIQLPQFLRDGQLPGQQPWAGVLGQSAGAPLFFLTREFCRLGIAKSDELKRLAFFVCTPVRRAAERIGWLEPGASSRTDFRSLARMSEKLFEKISSDSEYADRLLEIYDIPLLHLGLSG